MEDTGLIEAIKRRITVVVAAHAGLQPGGNEEILLAEAEHAAVLGRVIGIKAVAKFFQGVQIVLEALVGRKVVFARLGGPKAQRVGDPVMISGDGNVIRNGADAGRVHGAKGVFPVGLEISFGMPVEFDFDGMLGLANLENEAVA